MSEGKFEFIGSEREQEKELNPQEREQLRDDMTEYIAGLEVSIKEIRSRIEATESEEEREALGLELTDLEEQFIGLGEFREDIDEAESLTTKPVKS